VNTSNNPTVQKTKVEPVTLRQAQFDPRLKKYVHFIVIAMCLVTVFGVILIPFWLIFGTRYVNRYFENLHCELTKRSLAYKKGVWFQTERTIPLDKIQDLTFTEGPILKKFGLSKLGIETAGQSSQGADLSLLGIVDAHDFRADVLEQRDIVTDNQSRSQTDNMDGETEKMKILSEIRDSLKKIENKM
jgi:membrane protein YdbS with pleckstrin-like domain